MPSSIAVQSSLPSSHAARRTLRGLENTTPSPSSPSKLKVHRCENPCVWRQRRRTSKDGRESAQHNITCVWWRRAVLPYPSFGLFVCFLSFQIRGPPALLCTSVIARVHVLRRTCMQRDAPTSPCPEAELKGTVAARDAELEKVRAEVAERA